jgi:serine/threonine-protein kinase HipA
MRDALNVWMNGELVGVWFSTRSGNPAFAYEESWLRSPAARALSLSLPITAGREIRGPAVENYFDNLLPDNEQIRKRLRSRFKARSTEAFDLLSAIGRDCVGAVQLLPTNMSPDGWDRIESEPLTDDAVERILNGVTSDTPLGMRDTDDDVDFRISIAGAQEKTALLKFGDIWRRPHGATPTTHILKLPLGLIGGRLIDMSESVENEWLCAQIVRELGLTSAETEMAAFGKKKALVVKRFDRRWQGVASAGEEDQAGFNPKTGTWIARLPQEDFCQATGTSPDNKYEKDGGPTMRTSLELLAASEQSELDRSRFIRTQLAFWLLAAIDGHAKNYSIFHRRGGSFAMTPLYDILSAWPVMGEAPNKISRHKATLAMAVRSKNAHYKLLEIRTEHWFGLAEKSGIAGMWGQMVEMVEGVDAALARVQIVLPSNFPPRVWSAVEQGTRDHAVKFLDGVKRVLADVKVPL